MLFIPKDICNIYIQCKVSICKPPPITRLRKGTLPTSLDRPYTADHMPSPSFRDTHFLEFYAFTIHCFIPYMCLTLCIFRIFENKIVPHIFHYNLFYSPLTFHSSMYYCGCRSSDFTDIECSLAWISIKCIQSRQRNHTEM